jgi:hypothetical protein
MSAGKMMATIFWDIHNNILNGFKPCGALPTAFTYWAMLKALRKQFHVRGLACFPEGSCCCIIMLDNILLAPLSLPC